MKTALKRKQPRQPRNAVVIGSQKNQLLQKATPMHATLTDSRTETHSTRHPRWGRRSATPASPRNQTRLEQVAASAPPPAVPAETTSTETSAGTGLLAERYDPAGI